MKFLLHLSLVCILLPAWSQHTKLFVAAGQSNAVGMGDSAISKAYNSNKTFEYRFTGDSLKSLADPVGFNELHFEKANTGSCWPAFAKTCTDATGDKIIIVQAARGG